MPRLHPYALIAVCVLVGCAPASDSDIEADRAAVRAVIDEEVRAANAGDADAFLAIFSDDAVAIPPNAPAVAGDAVREWVRSLLEQVDIALSSYEDEQLILAGDYAIHHYSFTWTVTPKGGGEAVVERGQGIHILRREQDGSWMITHDIWNSSPAPGGI